MDDEQRDRRIYAGFEKHQEFVQSQDAFLSLQCPPERLADEQYHRLQRLSAVVSTIVIERLQYSVLLSSKNTKNKPIF